MKIGNSEKQISGLQRFQETEFEDCKGSDMNCIAWLGLREGPARGLFGKQIAKDCIACRSFMHRA